MVAKFSQPLYISVCFHNIDLMVARGTMPCYLAFVEHVLMLTQYLRWNIHLLLIPEKTSFEILYNIP